ncbi:DUF1311 domain-containing protein [Maribius pontilimi]|uniref:DUF1311 domain-containing protein n=1 Tax=Palleronia pontilimi TaxID=1964209 RepID=A0A934IBV3_9RHOB|nr:lysozyme inhibitor LprI family protein [Palleronia pontilimi]MBJ3764259.1 DUF1311 domain-containing protein [Palleronia pontilimi]
MKYLVCIAGLMVGAAAQAQDVNCPGAQTQLELNECAARAWQDADAELNRLWRIVKPQADRAGTGQALLDAQRAWLRYRDATCDAEAAEYGRGSIVPYIIGACATRLTLARNAELRALQR